MYQNLKKGAAWQWGEAQQKAFDALKEELCKPGRALKHFDPSRPTVLHTDWSQQGIGAVLGQVGEDGQEFMVASSVAR
jgi:hypothetical protein